MAWRSEWAYRSHGTTASEATRESWRDLVAEQAQEMDEDEEQSRAETDVVAGARSRSRQVPIYCLFGACSPRGDACWVRCRKVVHAMKAATNSATRNMGRRRRGAAILQWRNARWRVRESR